jgi:DMSO/TMAO reductase YedYZ molybdopterin-dependent catalytic subunit
VSPSFVSRGFVGRRREPDLSARIPPGQYRTRDFPVLSAGPTPRTPLGDWSLEIQGLVATERRWSWDQFRALPREPVRVDTHCATKWSTLDTAWEGVALDALLGEAGPTGAHAVAFCDGGYTTNLPLDDLTGGKAWVVDTYDGAPLAPEHGGPVRLLVPHLYFWKSAKWLRGIVIVAEEALGFWESLGYPRRGDPWLEQRYAGD